MDDLAGILDALPDATLVVDDDGVVVFANRNVDRVLGYDPADLEGRVIEDLLHAPDRDEHELVRTAYLRDPKPRPMGSDLDLYARRADGSEVPVAISLGPIERDGDTFVVTTIVDISRKREREAKLHRRTETLAALHHATQELLKTTDEAVAAEAAVEYVEDVLRLPLAALWLHDERDDTLVPAAWTAVADDVVGDHPPFDVGGDTLVAEAFRDGDPRYVPDTHEEPDRFNPDTPVRSDFIVPLGRYGVLVVGSTDPDAFDDADRTVARLWGATVTMVFVRIERERQLRKREREVAHERDRLEEFASIVSHDLRNPLNVAAGHLELVREEVESEQLDTVATALERMNALVEDMLTLARQGESIDDMEPVEVGALVESCWNTVETDDAELVIVDDCTVLADRNRLTQLFENLFRNAVEHGSTSSRTESGDAAEHAGSGVRIAVGTLSDGEGFYVADDGPGIDPGRRDEVFEAGVTTAPDGTGFGLKIVAEIAGAHGWSVDLVGSDGGGARFEFRGVDVID